MRHKKAILGELLFTCNDLEVYEKGYTYVGSLHVFNDTNKEMWPDLDSFLERLLSFNQYKEAAANYIAERDLLSDD